MYVFIRWMINVKIVIARLYFWLEHFQIFEKRNVLSSNEVQFSLLKYAFHCKFHREFNYAAWIAIKVKIHIQADFNPACIF